MSVPPSIQILAKANNPTLQPLVKVIIQCLETNPNFPPLKQSEFASAIKRLTHFNHPAVIENCALFLLHLAANEDVPLISSIGWPNILRIILGTKHIGISLSGALALNDIDGHIVVIGLNSHLMRMAEKQDLAAIKALTQIALHPKGPHELTKNGITKTILHLLESSNPEIVSTTITLITNLSFSQHPRVLKVLSRDLTGALILFLENQKPSIIQQAQLAFANLSQPTQTYFAILDNWVNAEDSHLNMIALYAFNCIVRKGGYTDLTKLNPKINETAVRLQSHSASDVSTEAQALLTALSNPPLDPDDKPSIPPSGPHYSAPPCSPPPDMPPPDILPPDLPPPCFPPPDMPPPDMPPADMPPPGLPPSEIPPSEIPIYLPEIPEDEAGTTESKTKPKVSARSKSVASKRDKVKEKKEDGVPIDVKSQKRRRSKSVDKRKSKDEGPVLHEAMKEKRKAKVEGVDKDKAKEKKKSEKKDKVKTK